VWYVLIEIQDLPDLEEIVRESLIDDYAEFFRQSILVFWPRWAGSAEFSQQKLYLF
jgi:hypothetical protein